MMKPSKILVLLFLLITTTIHAQSPDDVELIHPIFESPQMDKTEAKLFAAGQTFNNWGINRLGLNEAMKMATGKDVEICVCDTGKPTHPDLHNAVLPSTNFTDEQGGNDNHGHSTHVAGIIHEIAPDAKIMFMKVLKANGSGKTSWVVAGINECILRGAHIINLSLGSNTPSPTMKAAIDSAIVNNILVIAAAGNNGQSVNDNMGYPGRWEETISIGSINQELNVSSFSSSGTTGDVVAPGEKILSTWKDGKYIVLSGTSMATPYVAGMAALYIELLGYIPVIESRFEKTTTDISPPGFDRFSFWGHVDPIELLGVDTTENPPKDSIDDPIDPDPNPGNPPSKMNWRWFIPIGIFVAFFILYFVLKPKPNDTI